MRVQRLHAKIRADHRMILFYSECCPHCRMLLDTIKRHDDDRTIRLLSIEALKATNKLPPTIHSVPALLTMPEKQLMFGKAVFDYLLLPGSGRLLMRKASAQNDTPPQSASSLSNPSAFTLGSSSSDSYSLLDAQGGVLENHLDDRTYNWSNVTNGQDPPLQPIAPLAEDTRTKKDLPDIDFIRQQRDQDLRGEVNVNSLPHPVATRTS